VARISVTPSPITNRIVITNVRTIGRRTTTAATAVLNLGMLKLLLPVFLAMTYLVALCEYPVSEFLGF
jgi:hypothetical protein